MTRLTLGFFILLFTISAQAHRIKCEIFDLSAGENLIETEVLQVTDTQLRESEPYMVLLTHYLIQAQFELSYSDEKHLLFEIRTQEAVNAEYIKYTIPLAKIPANRVYKLGFLSTELTGLGNNTHSSCSLIFDVN